MQNDARTRIAHIEVYLDAVELEGGQPTARGGSAPAAVGIGTNQVLCRALRRALDHQRASCRGTMNLLRI
jgi:hypothetical protein